MNWPKCYINTNVVDANLARMVNKCAILGIELRPHVKTIHDPFLSSILREHGINKIMVSNIRMLDQFFESGWTDICLALPCPIWSIPTLQTYLDRGLRLTLYIDHMDQLRALDACSHPVQLCIDIDTGQQRTGVHWKHEEEIMGLIRHIQASQHEFCGLTTHFGQLYHLQKKADIIHEAGALMMKVLQLKEQLNISAMEIPWNPPLPLAPLHDMI